MNKSNAEYSADRWNMNFSVRLSSILLMIYYISLWKPPFLGNFVWQWPLLLAFSAFIFLILKEVTKPGLAKVFIFFFALQFIGSSTAILRTNNLDLAVYQVIGFSISIGIFFLLFHIMLHKLARLLFLVALPIAGSIWLIEVITRTNALGDIARTTFVQEGGDKNILAFLFTLLATMLLALLAFWKPTFSADGLVIFMRIGLLVGVVLSLLGVILLYSRSGLFTFFLSLFSVLIIRAMQEGRRGIISLAITVSIMTTLIGTSVSIFYDIFPHWKVALERVLDPELRTEHNAVRIGVLQKGIELISDNPFIGIGLGMFKSTTTRDTPSYLGLVGHNTYLVTWTELGIAGVASIGYWIFNFLSFTFRHFAQLNLLDKVGICIILPYFFMMATLDLSTNYYIAFVFFVAIMASNPSIDLQRAHSVKYE